MVENAGWKTIEGIRNLGEDITSASDIWQRKKAEIAKQQLEQSQLEQLKKMQESAQEIAAYPYFGLKAKTVPVDMEHVEVPATPAVPERVIPAPPSPIPTIPAAPGIAGAIGTGVLPAPPTLIPAVPAKGVGTMEKLPEQIPGIYQVQQAAFDALSPEKQRERVKFADGQASVTLPLVGPTAKPGNTKSGTLSNWTDDLTKTIGDSFLDGTATPDMLKTGMGGVSGKIITGKILKYIKSINPKFDQAEYTKDFIAGTGRNFIAMNMYQKSLLGDPKSKNPNERRGNLDILGDIVDKLPQNPITTPDGQQISLFNPALRQIALKAGNTALAEFVVQRNGVAEEIGKLIMGNMAPHEKALEMGLSMFPDSYTPAMFKKAIKAERDFLLNQMDAMKAQTLKGKSWEDFGIEKPTEEETPATQQDLIDIFEHLKTQ